jgi:hypothetical protein
VLIAPAVAPTEVRLSVVVQDGWVVDVKLPHGTAASAPRFSIPLTTVAPVEVAVSVPINTNLGAVPIVAPPGTLLIDEVTVYESDAAKASPVTETVPAVVESDLDPVNVPVPAVTVTVNDDPAVPENNACDGAELSTPIPNAATATSAMRLKFVVFDICFLSIVVTRNFLVAASR